MAEKYRWLLKWRGAYRRELAARQATFERSLPRHACDERCKEDEQIPVPRREQIEAAWDDLLR